jgi:hypothetical protein
MTTFITAVGAGLAPSPSRRDIGRVSAVRAGGREGRPYVRGN